MVRQLSDARLGGARLGGVVLAVFSAATFGVSGTLASSLLATGWTPAAAVIVRLGVAAVVLTVPALLMLRGRWQLLRENLGAIVGFGLLAVSVAQFAYFNAVEHLSVGVALLLEYSGTVLVVGWLWVRHGKRPRRLTIAGAVTAIAGLVLVLGLVGGAGATHLDAAGLIWGLLAATGLAAYFVLSADESLTLPPLVLAWAGMLLGALTLLVAGLCNLLPLSASTADVQLLDHQVSWLVPVAGLSLVAAVIAYVAGIVAARLLGAAQASFIGLTEVLFAVLFAWLLLHETPTAVQFAGGFVVLAGIVLVRIDEQRDVRPLVQPSEVVGEPATALVGRAGESSATG